eukprot:2854755-Ditylum_brightwellii.AAC.1
MPPSASSASNGTGQGILRKGSNNHISVRKHDTKQTSSPHKKRGLIYEIIAKKTKKRVRKSTEKRKK